MSDIHLFGHSKSKATRKAQRFFSERRVPVHFHDVRKRPPQSGELRRWVQRLGVDAVLDPESPAYVEQGLRYVSASEEDWLDRLARDPRVLRLPLARCGNDVAAGDDPDAWERFVQEAKGR